MCNLFNDEFVSWQEFVCKNVLVKKLSGCAGRKLIGFLLSIPHTKVYEYFQCTPFSSNLYLTKTPSLPPPTPKRWMVVQSSYLDMVRFQLRLYILKAIYPVPTFDHTHTTSASLFQLPQRHTLFYRTTLHNKTFSTPIYTEVVSQLILSEQSFFFTLIKLISWVI